MPHSEGCSHAVDAAILLPAALAASQANQIAGYSAVLRFLDQHLKAAHE